MVGLEGPEYFAWLGDQPEAEYKYTVLMGANTVPGSPSVASPTIIPTVLAGPPGDGTKDA